MFKVFTVSLLCVLVLGGFPAWAGPDQVSVSISGDTYLSGASASLKDVAVIKGGDSFTRKALEDVVICRVPLPGQYVRVSKATLYSRIRNSKIDMDRFTLESPDNFRIYSASGYIYKKDILKAAVDYLKEQGISGSKIFPSHKDLPQRVEVPASGRVSYRSSLVPGDNLAVDVVVVVDESETGTYRVAFTGKGGVPALKPGAVTSEEKPALDNPAGGDIDTTASMAKAGFKIRKGDPLKVFIRRKNLIITVDGKAQENGAAGDIIRVSTIGGKNIVKALILDRSTAVADL